MPQDLLGAPFTFAENISHIFSDMTSFVSAYFDDIVIFSATEEEGDITHETESSDDEEDDVDNEKDERAKKEEWRDTVHIII